MKRLIFTVFLAAACNNGGGSYDPASGVSGGVVAAAGQPESVSVGGKAAAAASGQVAKLNAAAADDLRPDAGKTAAPPAVDAALDPRAFVPGGAVYTPGAGVPARDLRAGRVAVPFDGKAVTHPACAHPLAAPGTTATTGLTVDGKLTDWPVGGVVAIDRAGDATADDLDLREVYFARDATDVYFAAKTAGDWKTTDDGTRELIIELTQLVTAADTTQVPYEGTTQRFYVRGSGLFQGRGRVPQGTGIGQVDYAIAVSADGIEVRLPKATAENALGAAYGVNIMTHDLAADRYDRAGSHVVGLTDDYACLVPLGDAVRMVVFRRGAGVVADAAEVAYRAFLASSQAVDFTVKDWFSPVDTLGMTVEVMATPVTLGMGEGVIVASDAADELGDAGTARGYFALGAYAQAMAYAAYDYKLPGTWAREGFARWMGVEAMGSYYGEAVAQHERLADALAVARGNAANPAALPALIDDAHWGTGAFGSAYYTAKAASFLRLLARLVPYDELQTGVLHEARNGWNLVNAGDFFHQLKDRKSYKGAAGDDLGQGWLSGAEVGAPVPPALLGDADGDGLLDHQESDARTQWLAADTDADGMTDAAELVLGTPPTAPQGLGALVADNYLGDWDLLAPAALQAGPAATATSSCGEETQILRFGVVYAEGWLLVPLELKALPTNALQVSLTVVPGSGPAATVTARWGDPYVLVSGGAVGAVRAAPFTGKTLELAVNAETLGWTGGTMPAGTTVTLSTLTTVACTTTAAVAPDSL